jgi:hypothetical protein
MGVAVERQHGVRLIGKEIAVMKLVAAIIFGSVVIAACGGGGDGGGGGGGGGGGDSVAPSSPGSPPNDSSLPSPSPPSYPSTALIQSDLEKIYASEQSSLSDAIEQQCIFRFARQGLLGSSSEVDCIVDLKSNSVLQFLNNATSSINAVSANQAIDSSAVSNLMLAYRNSDLNWIENYAWRNSAQQSWALSKNSTYQAWVNHYYSLSY